MTRSILTLVALSASSAAYAAGDPCTSAEEADLRADFATHAAGQSFLGESSWQGLVSLASSASLEQCVTDGSVYAYSTRVPWSGTYMVVECEDSAGCDMEVVETADGIDVYSDGVLLNPAPYEAIFLDTFVEGGSGPDRVVTDISHMAIIATGAGDDGIVSGMGYDYILSGSGNDVVVNPGGEDMVYLQSGDDLFIGSEDADYVNASSGDDLVFGNGGDDRLWGYAGADLIDGGAGDDRIGGGDGDDSLMGGEGADVVTGDMGDDVIDGGAGDDDLYGGDGTEADASELDYGEDVLVGGAGSDLIEGGDQADLIYGGDGDDYLFGGGDDDVIFGDDGNDYAKGGSGDDILAGGAGDDELRGNQGRDVVWGGSGSGDQVYGGDSYDKCAGDERNGCEDGISSSQKDDIEAAGDSNRTIIEEMQVVYAAFLEDGQLMGEAQVDTTMTTLDALETGWWASCAAMNTGWQEAGSAASTGWSATANGWSWFTSWLGGVW